jgi:MFS transporter, SP family, galactose:H+ symporter
MSEDEHAPEVSLYVKLGAAFALVAGLLFGYDLAVISGAIVFIKQDFSLTPVLEELVISAHILGALSLALFGGVLADRMGRRRVLILAGLISGLGAILTSLAGATEILLIGRFIVGAGITIASIAAPLYAGEIAPARQRGHLVSLYTVGLSLGVLAAYSVDYLFASLREWQWMLGLGAVPSLALAVGFYLLPETPRWLSGQGRTDEAHRALERISGRRDVADELEQIGMSRAQGGKGSWSDLLAPTFRRPLVLGIGISVFRSAAGFSVIRFYSPEIFQDSGFDGTSTAIGATVGIGILMVITTFTGSKLVDRSGRRPLLFAGFLGMAVAMTSLGFTVDAAALHPVVAPWAAVLCVLGFTAFLGLGPAAAYRVVIAEIFPTRIRGRGASVCAMANNVANLFVAGTYLTLAQLLGHATSFWLYGAIGFGASAFVYCLFPEMKGRTLEEIERYWEDTTQRGETAP